MLKSNKIIKWVKNNQNKIILTIALILVAVLGFQMGRLSVLINQDGNIVFKQTNQEELEQFFNQKQGSYTYQKGSAVEKNQVQKGQFIGSKNSNKYHLPSCHWASRIKPENRIWFENEADAQENGYIPASCVDKSY